MMNNLNRACPWYYNYTVGAFAADSIVRVLDESVSALPSPFGSSIIKRLVRLRRGFTFEVTGIAGEDARFLGAVLAKIAQRGFPAPCSLKLERFILQNLKETGLLKEWTEQSENGFFAFKIQPNIRNFSSLIKACYFAELLLNEEECESLITLYHRLCTEVEMEFFSLVYELCSIPQISLFLIPQRFLITMVRSTRPNEELQSLVGRRVDFAVELPNFQQDDSWLRIVIEIDDTSHKGAQKYLDDQRDSLLINNGWKVIRLFTEKKHEWKHEARKLVEQLRTVITDEVLQASAEINALPLEQRKALMNAVLLPIAEAQLTVAVARWIYSKDNADLRIFNPQGFDLEIVLECIDELLTHVEKLYGLRYFGRPKLVNSEIEADLTYFLLPSAQAWDMLNMNKTVLSPTVVFSDYEDALLENALPKPISKELLENNEDEKVLTYFLQQIFRKVHFWEGQTKIIRQSLQLRPVVGLLPTAGGKSLCYQMASILQPGFAIVIQPLRSLMWDQQDNLDAVGIHRSSAIISYAEITPDDDDEVRLKEEGYRAIEKGLRFFVFISPERFQIPEFREQVKTFTGSYPISFCVVDEAHCVSEWGHDFRPAYLNIGRLVPAYCTHRGYKPTFIALTGTASQNVLTDILRELLISEPDAIVAPESFDRPELQFEVIKVRNEERLSTLKSLLKNLVGYRPGQPMKEPPSGLIFSYFVNDKYIGVADLRNQLRNSFPELAKFIEMYSGVKPHRYTDVKQWGLKKINLHQEFKRNSIPILVCTHSFGMGIDKPDIRFTIHFMLPRSLEEFYQQAGRAGRDHQKSQCYIIFSDDQPELADMILDPVRVPIEKTSELIQKIPREQQSDPLRNLWFLQNSFLGKDKDKSIINYVWNYIASNLLSKGDRLRIELPFDFLPDEFFKGENSSDLKQQNLEKAIYRLLVIGAIDDYAKDWTKKTFIVSIIRRSVEELHKHFEEYLKRYATEGEVQRYLLKVRHRDSYVESVIEYSHQVVEFVYDRIERRRRRAIWEMLQAVRDAEKLGIQSFREQLNNYMTESEFTKPVKELTTRISPYEWFDLLKKAEGVDGLIKLFGACRRQLEEFPEHPGLLLLTGFCRLNYGEDGLRDIGSAFIVLKQNYSAIDRVLIAKQTINLIKERFPGKLNEVLLTLMEIEPSRELARLCYAEALPYSSPYAKAIFILIEEILKTLNSSMKEVVENERIA